MIYERFKKGMLSLALGSAVVLSTVVASNSQVQAQGYYQRGPQRQERWDRNYGRWERDELRRIRRLDRNRMLRYRYNNAVRVVGYYDYFGRFHAVGFYDRFGRFHRY
jgi:hypothetical protein